MKSISLYFQKEIKFQIAEDVFELLSLYFQNTEADSDFLDLDQYNEFTRDLIGVSGVLKNRGLEELKEIKKRIKAEENEETTFEYEDSVFFN